MAASRSGLSLWYFRPRVQSYTPRSHHAIVVFNLPVYSISLLIDPNDFQSPMARSSNLETCMSYVIAVAAPIGGGKSSLVKALARALHNAPTIHFDDYERATEMSVSELNEWMARGADFEELKAPNLANDLAALKFNSTVINSATQNEAKPDCYVVFEMPLGKEYKQTALLIDLLIWVDVPLDIALARKLKEFTATFLSSKQNSTQKFVTFIDNYLNHYLTTVRNVLVTQEQRVRTNADIIVDGRNSLDAMVQQSLQEIMKKFPQHLL
jgi:uridine kinase